MERAVLKALTKSELFAGLNTSQIDDILASVPYLERDVPAGQVVLSGDYPSRHMIVVLQGSIDIMMTDESGKSIVIDIIGPPNIVAPTFVTVRHHMPVSAQTSVDSHLMFIKPEDFRRLIDSNSVIRWNYICIMNQRCALLTDVIYFLSMLSNKQKILLMIRDEVRRQGSMTVTLKLSRQGMAHIMGVEKFSVKRCLKQLQDEGIITVDGKQITVLDEQALHFNYL